MQEPAFTYPTPANLGEIIDVALEAIERENKEKLDGVFHNIRFNSESALGRPPSATSDGSVWDG